MSIAVQRPFDEIDASTLDFWSLDARTRDERLAVLRRDRPVSWQRPPAGMPTLAGGDPPGYWAVVRHADVIRVSRDPETFCSSQGVQLDDFPAEVSEAAGSFLVMDHPRHTALRRLVSTAFTPRRVAALETRISALAAAMVDDLIERGAGDFVEVLSKPLPSAVFAEMMGVGDEDRERVCGLANDMVAWNDPDTLDGRDGLTLMVETLIGLYGAASTLADQRRARPADDILTGLVNAEVDGQRLSDEEIGAFFVLLSVAANDTTRQSISHGMSALCRFPDQRALLASDPERYLPGAVEEIVRWATPVMTFRRTATRDVDLGDVAISEGDKVVLFYVSANRDETVFADPWRLDITREPAHLGFGGGGPHFCLGASLARTMLRAVFSELVERAPSLTVGEPAPLLGNFIQGITSMPYRIST